MTGVRSVWIAPAALAGLAFLWFLARGRTRGGSKRLLLRAPPLGLAGALLAGGARLGVQRVVAALARVWPRDRAELVICVHQDRGPLRPEGVRIVELAAAPPKLRVLVRPLLHWRVLARERPDAVVSFVPGDNLSLLALRQLPGAPRFALAVSENIHVSSQLADYPLGFR